MKKLLSLLASVSLVATASTSAVACGSSKNTPPPPKKGPSAQSIKDKIKVTTVALRAKTSTDTSKPATDEAIKDALFAANAATKLTKDELGAVSFANVELKDNEQANKLKATIKSGGTEASITLTVIIHATAVQISAKITDPDAIIGIPAGTSTDLDTTPTQNAIKKALKTKFSSLSNYDLTMIGFDSGVTLTTGETKNVINLKIDDDGGSKTIRKKLTDVEVHRSASDLKKLIDTKENAEITIPSNSNTSISNKDTQDAIKNALQVEEAGLTNYDLTTIGTFSIGDGSSTTLSGDEANNIVNFVVTDDSGSNATAKVTLNKVRISSTTSEFKTKLALALTYGTSQLIIPAKGNQNTNDASIRKEIRESLKTTANNARANTVSTYDINNLITVAKNESITTAARLITFTIKDASETEDTFTLNVKSTT